MKQIDIKEKNVSAGIFQFIFPFSIKVGSESALITFLKNQQFTAFQLNHANQENAFYGGIHVSHEDMKKFFLPLASEVIFPPSGDVKGFQRFSKALNKQAFLSTKMLHIPVQIHSIDLTICPFELAFLTIRTEISNLVFSQTMEFASIFQKMQGVHIKCEGNVFQTVLSFIKEYLFPGVGDFFDSESTKRFDSNALPLSQNDGGYCLSLISLKEEETIETVDVFRSGLLDGFGPDGKPFIHANNPDYIENFVKQHGYAAWLPNRYYLSTDFCFSMLTNEENATVAQLAGQAYGFIYYTCLLNLFYKVEFLKIIKDYSKLNIENNQQGITKLIYRINSFTSNYFFLDHSFHPEGNEFTKLLRNSFKIDTFYNITKEALFSLFKYEENAVTKRDSLLLLILTLFTVICGIFSMNLFTHDLAGDIKWSHFKKYNPFEAFAVFIVLSGLIVTFTLLLQSLYQGMINRINRKKWFLETFLSAKSKQKS